MTTTGLPIEFESNHGCGRLTLAPEVNSSPWDVVEKSGTEVIRQVEAHNVSSLIVDLSPLNYLGSAQVALLVRVWKTLSAKNGKMVVEVTSPVVREVLKTAGLSRLWPFVENRAAAYAHLGINPEGTRAIHPAVPILGGLGGVAALVATALGQFRPEVLEPRIAGWTAVGAAGVSALFGAWTAWRAEGVYRALGFLTLLAGLGVIGAQLYRMFSPA